MKIGILTYHAACNFGAFLQLLSTVEYVRKRGDNPLVINWIPCDFEDDYKKRSKLEVRELYANFRSKYFNYDNKNSISECMRCISRNAYNFKCLY